MTFDALNVEYAFAELLEAPIGKRGLAHDADFFRGGDPKNLAKALARVAKALEKRIKRVRFDPADSSDGGPRARIDVAISRLHELSAKLAKRKTLEPEDYHWEIIGCLVRTIAALLEKAE